MTSPSPEDDYVSPWALAGAMIDEKYRVDRVIGKGGVGLVVAATLLATEQRVAIKMIRDDVPMQRELLDRFQREARTTAMIRSEHVARILDVGRLPTGRPYIVMEYLEGEDLEQVLARSALPVTAAVDFSLQACEALAEAHRAGIVHRDLKPANIFLTQRDGAPLVKVLDFGISKIQPLTAMLGGRSVETTSIMGSPGYMAPEQMKSTRDVDARADVWSLGTVLYEMLVGRPAFDGATMLEILNAIAACRPVPPSQRQPGVPRGLDAVIARCLTPDPSHRYATITELAVALQPFGSPAAYALVEQVLRISREPAPTFDEVSFPGLSSLSPLRSEPRPSALTIMIPTRRRRSRMAMLGLSLGGLSVVGAAGTAYSLRSAPPPPADSFMGVAQAGSPPAGTAPLPSSVAAAAVVAAPSPAPPATVDDAPVVSASSPPPAVPHRAVFTAPRRGARPASAAPGASPFGDRK